MKKSFITELSIFFLKIEITDFGVPFIPYADTIPRGYFLIRRSGSLAPNFGSEIPVGAPNFASKNMGDKYPKFCPLNFRYNPKCPPNCDSFPSCGNRTSQIFPLIWWNWLNLAPNFASKLDVPPWDTITELPTTSVGTSDERTSFLAWYIGWVGYINTLKFNFFDRIDEVTCNQ